MRLENYKIMFFVHYFAFTHAKTLELIAADATEVSSFMYYNELIVNS